MDIDGADVRAVLGRSSIPAPTAAALAEVDLASRRFVDSVGEGLPLPWVQAVEEAASGPDAGLADSLDRAVVATPLRARTPVWWYVVNILQWVLGITAVLGLLWLGLLWLLGFAQLPMETPTLGIIPVPLVMIAGGLLLGMLLGALSRWWARVGARHRRSVIAGRLRSAVGEVVERDVIAPVGEVLARHRETRELLVEAGA